MERNTTQTKCYIKKAWAHILYTDMRRFIVMGRSPEYIVKRKNGEIKKNIYSMLPFGYERRENRNTYSSLLCFNKETLKGCIRN